MRRTLFIALVIAGLAGLADAQVPLSGNVFAGYSYYNTNLGASRQSLNGWEGSVEGKFFPFVGIVADVSANYGSLQFPSPAGTCVIGVVCSPVSVNAHVENYLIGPRVSVSIKKIRPFAEAMFGAAHVTTHGFGSDTSFSTAVGGGLDYHLIPLVAWRLQGDYVRTQLFNTSQDNVRISTGIVIHF